MFAKIKSTISRNLINAKGWRTDRKIIVFESDDWGSIRIPNKKTLIHLAKRGFAVEKCAYVMNDSLESNDDLEILFDFIKCRKKTPVITANFLTSNPDFERIEQSNFKKYFSENLEKTLVNYPNHNNVKNLWLEGKRGKYFIPQLHGREHLNISQWMCDLRDGNKETMEAFHKRVFGMSTTVIKTKRNSYQAAFGFQKAGYKVDYYEVLKEAYEDFEKLFGFKPTTFIAPNYTWGDKVENITSKLGITHLQGTSAQRTPNYESNNIIIKRNFLGKSNKYGQKYLIRNVYFEPFSNPNNDNVSKALSEIKNAFFWKKPAIISMHRANFVGGINPQNRDRNLKYLNDLLNKIDKYWPDVEFLSSNELAELI